jgi:diaminopimelate epimerase
MTKFHKYQAIGNDYLVIEGIAEQLTSSVIQRICDRHRGLGSDGILVGGKSVSGREFALRIFNPDGSEAEKSGNGLRIFARYLWDTGLVGVEFFSVETKGGVVRCQVRDNGNLVFVEMGRASFRSESIPISGPHREVVAEQLDILGETLRITGVSVGNPHCVVQVDNPTRELACRLGPLIENNAMFPNRINAQFLKVLGPQHIRIEIWERGAGYTLASGSSSCAAAAASVRLGLCEGDISVDMPGGSLTIGVAPDFSLTMLGPAKKVATGEISNELFEEAG